MNRNDFYKELMQKYALDEEKIRINAIKQAKKPAWQRLAADYWKPAAGTAAAVAVTVAAVAYMNAAGSSVPEMPDAPTALSASQRLSDAERNYFNVQSESPFCDIYVTFLDPVSYNDVIMALSTVADSGEILIETLYTEDDILYGSEAVRAFAADDPTSKEITAVKVSALSMYYRDIQDLSSVYLAELGSDIINDDTFAPIPVDDSDPLSDDINTVPVQTSAAPAVITTPFSFDSPASEKPPVTTSTAIDTPDSSTLLPPADTSETAETEGTDIPEDEAPEISETTTAAPVTTEAPAETSPVNEITSSSSEEGGSPLLTEIYELNVENSLEVYLSGSNAIVLTKSAVYLYTFGEGAPQSVAFDINNPKINEKNSRAVMITGCGSDDNRSVIAVVDLESGKLHAYDVSANIGGANIGAIRYYPAGNKYFIKSVLGDKSFIHEAVFSEASGIQFRPLVESDGPVSIAGCKENDIFLTKADKTTGNTVLVKFSCVSGDITKIADFDSVMKIRRGADMESFALISGSGSYIYDVNIDMLVSEAQADENTELATCMGRTCFTSGGELFEINPNSQIERSTKPAKFNREAPSLFQISDTSPEKIVVTKKNAGTTASWIN